MKKAGNTKNLQNSKSKKLIAKSRAQAKTSSVKKPLPASLRSSFKKSNLEKPSDRNNLRIEAKNDKTGSKTDSNPFPKAADLNQHQIKIAVASNGIRLAVDEMKEVETVSIGVFVHTGSRNESKNINGISHFLEHMAFKGTKTRSAKKIAEEFENIGGYINAYTSKDKTVYYVKILKEYSEFAIEFLADILQNSVFDEFEIEKERGVILQEISMTNDTPDDIVFDYFQEAAYPKQAAGRSILGSVANVKKFGRQDFLNYIAKQYNYSNMAVVASGNIQEKDLLKWTEKYFTNLGKEKIAEVEPARYVGGEFLKEKKLEQVNLVLGFEGISFNHKDYYSTQALAMILGGGMSSRLFQEVRENHGLAYSISSFNYCHKDSGIFAIAAATTPEKFNKLLEVSCLEIKKICAKISDEELQRVKTQFKASIKMAKESTNSRMQKLGSDIITHNKIYSDQEIIHKIDAITKKLVVELAQKIFTSKPTMAMIGKLKGAKTLSDISL